MLIELLQAPTLQNMNDWQWSPTLISFDADPAHTTRSTSHHIIKVLILNRLPLLNSILTILASSSPTTK